MYFPMYCVKQGERRCEHGQGYDAFMTLSKEHRNNTEYYRIYTNYFFNRPNLQDDCYEKQTYGTATLSLICVDIPADSQQLLRISFVVQDASWIWKVLEEIKNCLHSMEGQPVCNSGQRLAIQRNGRREKKIPLSVYNRMGGTHNSK